MFPAGLFAPVGNIRFRLPRIGPRPVSPSPPAGKGPEDEVPGRPYRPRALGSRESLSLPERPCGGGAPTHRAGRLPSRAAHHLAQVHVVVEVAEA